MNIIMLISVIIIFLKAPVDNVNKPLDKKEHGIYRKRCRLILIIQCFIYLIFKSINLMVQLLEYKKKYQKKINVVVNNIDMVASSDKELNEKVYNRCLKCGSGIDSLVLSQDGYFRPCPELPESVFNLGGLDYLIDFINGNFRGDQLYQCIKKFCNEKDMIPCGALQEYYEKNICR